MFISKKRGVAEVAEIRNSKQDVQLERTSKQLRGSMEARKIRNGK